MVGGQGELGRLEVLGREVKGPDGKGSCQSVRCRRPGRRILVTADMCRRGILRNDACLSISGGLFAQLQGVGKGFLMCPNKLC